MWLAILAAVICNNIIGMLWYSPLMFMNTFLETTNRDPNANMSATILILVNVLAVIECFGLFKVFKFMNGRTLTDGALYGYLIWQFFVFPAFAVHHLFDTKPVKHLFLIAGHHLVALVIEGTVIAALQ